MIQPIDPNCDTCEYLLEKLTIAIEALKDIEAMNFHPERCKQALDEILSDE